MHYEVLSRALAYASCLSTMSLFATSMAIAAVNIGKLKPPPMCGPAACAAVAAKPSVPSIASKVHIETIATAVWSKKT